MRATRRCSNLRKSQSTRTMATCSFPMVTGTNASWSSTGKGCYLSSNGAVSNARRRLTRGLAAYSSAPVHCVVIGNDGLVYVCDRLGDRVEVFDKMGNFKRNIRIQSKTAHRTNSENAVGTAGWVGFSPDPAQKFMYVANGSDNTIHILDRLTGEVLSKFGRPGNLSGDLTDPHSIAVNSKGDIIIGEVPYGGKIQMWRAVRK